SAPRREDPDELGSAGPALPGAADPRRPRVGPVARGHDRERRGLPRAGRVAQRRHRVLAPGHRQAVLPVNRYGAANGDVMRASRHGPYTVSSRGDAFFTAFTAAFVTAQPST